MLVVSGLHPEEVAIVKRILGGNHGIFLVTLLLLWSVLAIAAAAMALWADPPAAAWVGLLVPALVATALSVAAYVLLTHERPRTGLPVSQRAPVTGDAHRILVVANETLRGRALHDEVARRAAERPTEVLVVAPALSSPLAHWTDAEDVPRAEAAARVREACASLAGLGVEARGEVAADDPLRAVEDALRTFGADEIVVSTHPPETSNWLEEGVVETLREFYAIPIVHVVVDHDREDVRTPSRT
jgi:GABA permease